MDIANIIYQISSLLVLMVVGVVLGKKNVISEQTAVGMDGLIMKLALPALIVVAMDRAYSSERLELSLLLILTSIISHFVAIAVVELWGKKTSKKHPQLGTLQFLTVFGNTAFIGLPVANAMLGSEGLFYATMFTMPFNFFLFGYGYFAMKRDSKVNLKVVLKNPGMIASFLGIFIFVANLDLPGILQQPLSLAGGLAIPLSLLTVGSRIGRMHLSELFRPMDIWIVTALRMLVFPLTLLLILSRLTDNHYLIAIPVIIFGTPVAMAAGPFTSNFGGDPLLASKAVALSNALAALIMPLVIWIMATFVLGGIL